MNSSRGSVVAPAMAVRELGNGNGLGSEVHRTRTMLQRHAPANVRRHGQRTLRWHAILVLGDLIALQLVNLGSALNGLGLGAALTGGAVGAMDSQLLRGGIQVVAAVLLGLYVTGNYQCGDRRHDPGRILMGCSLAYALMGWGPLWSNGAEVFPGLLLATILTWAAITAGRALIHRCIVHHRIRTNRIARAVLVGPGLECAHFATHEIFRSHYRLIGRLTPDGELGSGVIGDFRTLADLIGRRGIDTVFLCGNLSEDDFVSVVDVSLASGCELLSFGRMLSADGVQPSLTWYNGVPIISLTRPGLKAQQLLAKRVIDFGLALLALLMLAPLLLLIALSVKLTSPGPVFFRQTRVGLGGKTFKIFKFRSMCTDAEHLLETLRAQSIYADPRLFKMEGDPRVTRIGAFLRRTSLDELPQLFNVLSGEMSLVGPRPPTLDEVALYEEHHYCRFDVKPGITGPWQVAGRNQITDFERVVELEQVYIRNWSIGKDLLILVRTIPAVLKMNGAY